MFLYSKRNNDDYNKTKQKKYDIKTTDNKEAFTTVQSFTKSEAG